MSSTPPLQITCITRKPPAGKHVICEKPLATTSAETGELVRLAQASGLVHAVNFNIRFYPINRHLHQLVPEGGLGDVRLVSGHYLQDWLLLDTDWNWRLEPERGGSLRAVADIGSHWMDLTSYIAGQRIVSVMADLKTFTPVRRQPIGPVETFSNKPAGATTAHGPRNSLWRQYSRYLVMMSWVAAKIRSTSIIQRWVRWARPRSSGKP